jgi:hypothetical protein
MNDKYVAANPGFEIVDVSKADYSVCSMPVVAWKISVGFVYPVGPPFIILNEFGDNVWRAVKWPNGKVVSQDDGMVWDNVDRWINQLTKELEAV